MSESRETGQREERPQTEHKHETEGDVENRNNKTEMSKTLDRGLCVKIKLHLQLPVVLFL